MMTKNNSNENFIVIQQYLFGYRHGHRLLAGSNVLPDNLLKTFLVRTDSPGGSPSRPDVTILQGFPVPESKAYAVSRTLPDTSKGARQGTVLTHLILVTMLDLGREGIILPLITLLNKNPNLVENHREYELPIKLLIPLEDNTIAPQTILQKLNAREFIYRLYETPTLPSAVSVAPSAFESFVNRDVSLAELLLAAIWEQQWPRLRRTFSFFMGAWNTLPKTPLRYPPTVVIYPDFSRSNKQNRKDVLPIWVEALANDLNYPNFSMLRAFFRRAGADINDPVKAVKPLVEIYHLYESRTWDHERYIKLFELTYISFPTSTDAKWLKHRLFDADYWSKQTGFQTTQYIQILLDKSREMRIEFQSTDWNQLIAQIKPSELLILQKEVVEAFDEHDNPFSETFRNAYLDQITLDQLPSLLQLRQSLIQPTLLRHPSWLEEPYIWSISNSRQDSLMSALIEMYPTFANQLNLEKVMRNFVQSSGEMRLIEWIKRLPLPTFRIFLELLDQENTNNTFSEWGLVLTGRTNDVIDWLAEQSTVKTQWLLWICREVDYMAMWRPELDPIWLQVAQGINTYSTNIRAELATHAICTMVTNKFVSPRFLLPLLEPVSLLIAADWLNPRHRIYLSDHLPRLKKDHDNWDLGRRLDVWAAGVLCMNEVPKKAVLNAYVYPPGATRLIKMMRKGGK